MLIISNALCLVAFISTSNYAAEPAVMNIDANAVLPLWTKARNLEESGQEAKAKSIYESIVHNQKIDRSSIDQKTISDKAAQSIKRVEWRMNPLSKLPSTVAGLPDSSNSRINQILQEADKSMKSGNYESARETYKQAIDAIEYDAEESLANREIKIARALYQMGLAQEKLGKLSEARILVKCSAYVFANNFGAEFDETLNSELKYGQLTALFAAQS